jgi:hypothetical protein
VLIECRDDKTGAAFRPGDTVVPGDFPHGVISAWVKANPPVLQPDSYEGETDGRDA